MKPLVVNWLEKNALPNTCCIIFLCVIISCTPANGLHTNAQTQLQLGLAYIQLHQYDLAEKQLQKAVTSPKNRFDGERTLAYLYQTIGKSQKAMHLYQKLIQKYPTSSQTYNNYGVFLCQQKQYEQASLAFKMASNYDPENKQIQKNLILCNTIKNN